MGAAGNRATIDFTGIMTAKPTNAGAFPLHSADTTPWDS
jgi:hypothetical protein